MCEVGSNFILCRCAGDNIDKSNAYWQLFSLINKAKPTTSNAPSSAVPPADSNLSGDETLSIVDFLVSSDDMDMEVGDIVVPAIMDSPTYQSFCDELNSRQCFDTPIEHQNGDMLIIHLKGDEYRYHFFNNQWQPISLNINEPQRELNHSGETKGVDHIQPFEDDAFSDWL